MLNFSNLSLRRGKRILFEGVTMMIHPGWKTGITGANGTGKSSLFSLILNDLHHDTGDFSLPSQWVIAHVAQETPALQISAIDYTLDGDNELRQVERDLLAAEKQDDGSHLAELHDQFATIDGYTARSRAARLLHGLGFSTAQHELPVESFSGGWRMRLNLAQALMCRSDLLLLDEPTNHLDLDAVFWLEDWLSNYPGTLLLISHDRDFLDRITDHIAHIEHTHIKLYTGNYSGFEKIRAEQLAQQSVAFQRQQKEIAHIESFVNRFRAQATKARQAQSRIKALERMSLIAPAHVDSQFHFTFKSPEKLPDNLLKLEKASVGYGDKIILSDIDLTLTPGDRIGLLGPNGAGKSTLIKLLAGELENRHGNRSEAKDLKLGYFAQHQLEQLHDDDTPLVHLQRMDKYATEKDLRQHLGHFGFQGESALDPVGPLSGGEKARLVLALIVYQRPSLLLLDEPTNHLDIEMRHALIMALQDYEGAMVIISHDRHLLRTATDKLLLVSSGKMIEFDGDLDNYKAVLKTAESNDEKTGDTSSRKDQRRNEAEQRKLLQPLKNKIKKIEREIEKLQAEKDKIHSALSDADIYDEANKEKLNKRLIEQGQIDQALEEQENLWLELHEELEANEQ